jgi:hypothetical protein
VPSGATRGFDRRIGWRASVGARPTWCQTLRIHSELRRTTAVSHTALRTTRLGMRRRPATHRPCDTIARYAAVDSGSGGRRTRGCSGYSATPIRVLLAGGACNAMAGRLGRRRLLADHVTAPARRLGGPHLPVRMHAVGWDRRKRASPAISAYGRSSGGAALRAAGALRADASCGAHCAGSPVVGRCYFGRWAALSVPAKVARATRERCRVNLQCL